MSQQIKNFDPNDLFYTMAQKVSEFWANNKRLIICNEGGTRAGKTWDTFDLITYICDQNRNQLLDTYILRDTLTNNRDFTLKDWKKLQSINGIELIGKESPKPEFNLFGNNIYFRGLDDEENTEGYPSDILFFNEALELDKSQVSGLIMRCRKLIIFDWNPKLTNHWVFDYEGRPDVLYTNTTYKNNKHLGQTIIDGINSYNPDIEQNVINKTANRFRWRVYGLGLRTDMEGNVFNDSQLDKFSISEINIKTGTKIAFVDVKDQGTDMLAMPIGLLNNNSVYVFDAIYSGGKSEETIPMIIEKLVQYDIDLIVFESNNQGLGYLKQLIKDLQLMDAIDKETHYFDKYRNRLIAVPTPPTQSKHQRIRIQAETWIIKKFKFLDIKTGMYHDFYDSLLQYKYNEAENRKLKLKDDAPDALAGLSKLSQKYIN
jgi:PBSX family phage terminase large subunit